MNKNIYEEMAVIFENHIDEELNILVYVPVKIVYGYYNEAYDMFIDSDNNGYYHVSYNTPGNGFALRCNIEDLKNEYKVDSYNLAKKKHLKELKKYVFAVINPEDNQELFFAGLTSDRKHAKLYKDIDLDNIDMSRIEYNQDYQANVINDFNDEILNIEEMASEVKKEVIGQDKAIDDILTTLWTNSKSSFKDNMIVIGPTGVGKTAIIRSVAKLLGRDVYKASVAGISQAGYVGGSVSDILTGLITYCDGDLNRASNAIVVMDEFDKLASSKGGKIATESVQNELLTLIEDGEFLVTMGNGFDKEEIILSTENITFIGLGNFYGITKKEDKKLGFNNDINSKEISYDEITADDLIKYGFIPDLIGRMPIIINLNSLGSKELVDILKNSTNSILADRIKILNDCGINVSIDESAYIEIANKAGNTIGARALNGIVNKTFSKIFMDVSRNCNDYNDIIITKDTVNNPNMFIKNNVKVKSKVKVYSYIKG